MTTMAEVAAYYPALAEMAKACEEEVDKTWLDGPGLAQWIKDMGIRMGEESTRTRLRRWGEGGCANWATVDRFLTGTPYSLDDIPEHLWVERDRSQGFPVEMRRAAAEEYLNAENRDQFTRAAIADKYGVSVHTIRTWVDLARKGAI